MSSQVVLRVSCFRGLGLVSDPDHGPDLLKVDWIDPTQQSVSLVMPLSEGLVLRDALQSFVSKYVPQ